MYGYLFEGMSAGDLGRFRAGAMRPRHRWYPFPFPHRRRVQPVWFGPEFITSPRVETVPVLVRVTDGTGRVREMRGIVEQDRLMEALWVANDQILGTIPARNVLEIFEYGRVKIFSKRVYDNVLEEILWTLGFRV